MGTTQQTLNQAENTIFCYIFILYIVFLWSKKKKFIYEKIQTFFLKHKKTLQIIYFLYKATVHAAGSRIAYAHHVIACLMHAMTTPWLQLFLKDVLVWVKTGNATTQHTAMAWNQSMNHAMHLSNALKEMVHLVTYTSCRMSNNNCSPQTQGPYAPLLPSFLVFEWEQRINKWWF